MRWKEVLVALKMAAREKPSLDDVVAMQMQVRHHIDLHPYFGTNDATTFCNNDYKLARKASPLRQELQANKYPRLSEPLHKRRNAHTTWAVQNHVSKLGTRTSQSGEENPRD